MTETTTTSEEPELESGSGDLRKAKAAFWRALAKLLGILGLSCVPALVGWIDAHTKAVEAGVQAKNAAGAAAQETVTNALAYDEVVARLETLERHCLPEIVAAGAVLPPPPPPPVPTATAAAVVVVRPDAGARTSSVFEGPTTVTVEVMGAPAPERPAPRPDELLQLRRQRPKADREAVEMIQQQYLKGAF